MRQKKCQILFLRIFVLENNIINLINKKITFLTFFIVFFLLTSKSLYSKYIVNLVGEWEGINKSYSTEKGYRTWKKKITIFEQNERIFKGNFKYADGERNFLGTIRQNN